MLAIRRTNGYTAKLLHETLINLLRQPPKTLSIPQLTQIHALLLTSNLFPHFPSKLVYLFASSGNADYSYRLLLHSRITSTYVVDWNTVIRAFSSSGTPGKAIRVFVDMLRFRVCPDHFTFPFLVKASARVSSIEVGMLMHSFVLRSGYVVDLFVGNSLISMYAKCGRILCARKVFDEMPQRTNVSWNSMLDGYAKCGDLEKAREVFECMPVKDVVSWSAIIDGLVKGGEYAEALVFFEKMVALGKPKANEVTMVSVLRACAHLGALEKGKSMHCYIVENELPLTLVLLTSLMDMYAKCGAIDLALRVFREIPQKKSDVFLWNAIIGGLANHGYVRESLDLFDEMSTVGIAPDEITYLCLLSACAHGGLINEGWHFFEAIEKNGMTPKSEHYACMVDIMAKAGVVEEAYELLNRMPMKPTPATLGALLSGCMNHGRLDLAELLGKKLVEVDPRHDGRYVGLSNVYASVKRWDEAKTWRQAMDVTGVKKFPGFSYVEKSGLMEMFKARDKTHPRSLEIYGMLDVVLLQMRKGVDYDDEGRVVNG